MLKIIWHDRAAREGKGLMRAKNLKNLNNKNFILILYLITKKLLNLSLQRKKK